MFLNKDNFSVEREGSGLYKLDDQVSVTKTRRKRTSNDQGTPMPENKARSQSNEDAASEFTIASLRAQASALELQAKADALQAELLRNAKNRGGQAPRGTPAPMRPLVMETTPEPIPEPAPPPPPPDPTDKNLPLAVRIEVALLIESATYAGLAKRTNVPIEKIRECVDKLHAEDRIGRVIAFHDDAVWAWCLTSFDNDERKSRIKKLRSERPLEHADVVRALGPKCDYTKANNDITELRRHENMWDYSAGRGRRAIYFIPPDNKQPPPHMDGRLSMPKEKRTKKRMVRQAVSTTRK